MATIDIRRSNNYEESYSDRGTGANADVSVWRPKLLNNEFRVSYCASGRSAPTVQSPVVKQGSDSRIQALAAPSEFVCVWTDQGTGGKSDGSLWRASPPSGYVALSDVAIHMGNSGISPGTTKSAAAIDPSFRCVHRSLVKDAELGSLQWCDAGSGGKYDGACWNIRDSPGMRVSRGRGDSPPNQQYRLKAFLGNLYKDMKLVFSIENPLGEDQPPMERTITQGVSITQGSEGSFTSEIGAEISIKASAGVEGICSSETAAKFTSKLTSTNSISSSSTSTKTDQIKVPILVKARTRTELWQMVVTDSAAGASSGKFLIQSEIWELRYVAL